MGGTVLRYLAFKSGISVILILMCSIADKMTYFRSRVAA